jgi:nitrile hydratase
MNGAHDMGGMHGFGPVIHDEDEPVFHESWERRIFGVSQALGAARQWNLDMSRAESESHSPAVYLAMGYYEIWLNRTEVLAQRHGLITAEELKTGEPSTPKKVVAGILSPEDVAAVHSTRSSSEREANRPAVFAVGDTVRFRNIHPRTHTRLPRYARGRTGTIAHVHGCHVFPDTNAVGKGECAQWLYSVEVAARDLWGGDGDPRAVVYLDTWEPYLEQ